MEAIKSNKLILVSEVILFVLIVFLDAKEILPISQTIYLVPIIFLILRLKKESIASIGLRVEKSTLWNQITLGVIIGIFMESLAIFTLSPAINQFFETSPDLSELSDIKGNATMLVVFLLISWVLGAFGEEICFRGFLMNRIAAIFDNTKIAWVIAVILSSVLFGWGHTEQGLSGWVMEGINAMLLGFVFVLFDKRLTVPIVAHGVSNTMALIMIYFGTYPGVY